jgi:hypothetical protein
MMVKVMFTTREEIQLLEKIFESEQRSDTFVEGIFVKNHAAILANNL